MNIETKIAEFSIKPEIIIETLAILKVGNDKDDPVKEIISRVIANILLRFHQIPLKTGDS